jgi:hypothetical protein
VNASYPETSKMTVLKVAAIYFTLAVGILGWTKPDDVSTAWIVLAVALLFAAALTQTAIAVVESRRAGRQAAQQRYSGVLRS